MKYDPKSAWIHEYKQRGMMWPSEWVIRIFKGSYPRLNLPKRYQGKKICDVGCGDGRHILFLKSLGFDVYGVEISDEIVQLAKANLERCGIKDADIRVGRNDSIPFDDDFFDFLLSWNACYYMWGHAWGFEKHVAEFARCLKGGGYLIMSIPKPTHYIFQNAERINSEYWRIRGDPVRNGEIFRVFKSEEEIAKEFEPYFHDFRFGSLEEDIFGEKCDYYIVICRRKRNTKI